LTIGQKSHFGSANSTGDGNGCLLADVSFLACAQKETLLTAPPSKPSFLAGPFPFAFLRSPRIERPPTAPPPSEPEPVEPWAAAPDAPSPAESTPDTPRVPAPDAPRPSEAVPETPRAPAPDAPPPTE